jgi:hypothetical protein
MAKFQIKTPGGYEVEVEAANEEAALSTVREKWQTMPKIIGKNGDTRIFERANGERYLVSPGYSTTDPDRIAQALDGATGGDLATQMVDRGFIEENTGAARAGEFLRGGLAGSYLDEAVGKVAGEKGKAGMRALSGAMQRERPGETLALNLAGGVSEAAGIAAAAPAAVAGAATSLLGQGSRLSQIGRGFASGGLLGGLQGAFYGSGEGTDGAQSRVEEAKKGAASGATFGSVLGAGAPVVQEVASNLIGRFARSDVRDISKELGISQDAAKVIKQTFALGGGTQDAVNALQKAGSEAMLADAGVAARVLLDASGTAGAVPAQTVSKALDGRVARSGQALTNELDFRLGSPEGVETITRGIRKDSQAARQSAYDAALSKDIDWLSPAGEDLRGLLATTPQEVMERARRSQGMAIPALGSTRRYADEISANAGTVQPGGAAPQARASEAEEVGQFFKEYEAAYKAKVYKRPFSDYIRSAGGIDPSGTAAAELRARGVTSRTHPALYRVGGMKDVDNLPLNEFDVESIKYADGGDSTGYADPEDIYEALADEGRGVSVGSAGNDANAEYLNGLESMVPEYEARRAALAAGVGPTGKDAPDARPYIPPTQTVGDVDQVKRALDDIYRTNDGQGLLGGVTDFGRLAGDRALAVRNALSEAVPEYGTALKTAADPISRRVATEFGSGILGRKTTRERVKDFMDRASGGEILAVKRGLRSQIDEIMANVRAVSSDPNIDAREAVSAVNNMNNRASREKLAMILGDEAPEFFSKLDEASATFNLRADVAANSRTSIRRAVQGNVDETTAPGVIGTAARGEGVDAAKRVVQGLTGMTDEFSAEQKQRVYADIARALTEKTGDDARTALAVLNRAMDGQALTDAESGQLGTLISGALFASGSRSATIGAGNERRQSGQR